MKGQIPGNKLSKFFMASVNDLQGNIKFAVQSCCCMLAEANTGMMAAGQGLQALDYVTANCPSLSELTPKKCYHGLSSSKRRDHLDAKKSPAAKIL
jgi:hypothetical protein